MAGLASIPWLRPIQFDHDGLGYLGYALVAVIAFVLYRTRLGLLIRATGEHPEVVAATGGRLRLVQLGAVVTGAGLAGVGGAELSVGYVGNWFNDMSMVDQDAKVIFATSYGYFSQALKFA